ncbi:hypothetical protein [Candidatus Protochlamydia phocaeensis]|uniref:hypothetical protein n=1 Tax=Candidatus Protochlamydia phocaeensis TaxID=1414722 RepID=UPI0008387702|nr:hypothetical protein [Candidatus Protochlamydia phocaeensis]
MDTRRAKLQYRGSLVWLIFWLIVFFPIALVLLFTASAFELNQTTYDFQYNGSRFWLCFWILVFFPLAFLLLFINGISVRIIDHRQNPYS